MEHIKAAIRDVPDFPKPGIVFKDITPVLQDAEMFATIINSIAENYASKPIDRIVGIESRGFILGAALALKMNMGLAIIRKLGKLPSDTIKEAYALEYGTDQLEIHRDAIDKGQNVLIVDDLLATGGTAEATVKLVKTLGGNVTGVAFAVELAFLDGRKKLDNLDVFSLIQF